MPLKFLNSLLSPLVDWTGDSEVQFFCPLIIVLENETFIFWSVAFSTSICFLCGSHSFDQLITLWCAVRSAEVDEATILMTLILQHKIDANILYTIVIYYKPKINKQLKNKYLKYLVIKLNAKSMYK